MVKIKKLSLIVVIATIVSFSGCGSESSSLGTSKLNFHINSVNDNNINLKSTSSARGVSRKSSSATSFPVAEASSIASGLPEEMKIYIKSIKLKSEGNEDGIIFSDSEGKAVNIDNGKVDISALFQANINSSECFYDNEEIINYEGTEAIIYNENNGTVIIKEYKKADDNTTTIGNTLKEIACSVIDSKELAISEGTYQSIEIEFLRKAKIKGCVSAIFQSADTKEGIAGEHTYCTQSNKSTFTGVSTQNEDFENKTAELMKIDLQVLGGITTDEASSFTVDYKINGGITLKKDSENDLTLLFDLNRMLRYFNDGRIDNQPVNPSEPTGQTYFFTLDMQRDHVSYAFVGKVGNIYGYEITLEGCTNEDRADDGTHICADDISKTAVSLWMTSIYDQNNNHVVTNFMPDDNNAWTVIKGSTEEITAPIKENSDGTFNITYTLGEGSDGTIYNFKHVNNINDLIEGSTFTGFQNSYGKLYIKRKL